MNNKTLYDFSGFRVDTGQRCLWRGEDLVSLTPKAFETLLVLIKNKGNVVSKDSILDEVWKDTFVEEATLAQNISTLRKTLAKYDENVEFIVTVPRRGYRFVADVTEINTEEEELIVERRSVTHIVAEQEQINDSPETSITTQKDIATAKNKSFLKSRKLLLALPLTVLALLITVVLAIYYFSFSNTYYNSKFQEIQQNTLFSSGNLFTVTASPDGKYVAFVERNADGDDISLKQIESGNRIKVLPKSNLQISGIAFSPDGESIYYSAYKRGQASPRIGSLYKIPILGGAPQEILKDIDSPVAISPDKKKLAFRRNKLEQSKSTLVITDADGSNEKELVSRDLQNGFSGLGVSWSPDGKSILTAVADREDPKQSVKLLVVNTENAEQKILKTPNWLWIGKTAWLKDGSGIAVVAYGARSPNITDEIWFVSYPDGEARPISNGINGIGGFGMSDELNSIVATKMTRITSSYVSSLDDMDNAKEIAKTADEESLFSLGASWKDNKELVFSKTQNGNADIWKMNSDGTEPKQLTSDKSADYAPRVSPDGRYIFFLSNRKDSMNIWRMDANGENPTEIIRAKNVFPPTISPNNDYIYYSAQAPKKLYNVLWRANLDGENAKQLTDYRTYGGKISPDGKYILCFYPDKNEDPLDIRKPVKITVLSTEDGKIVKQFAPLKSRALPILEWKTDGESFLILNQENEKSVLSLQKLDTDKPKVLKTWEDETIYQIEISDDGEKIFFVKGKEVDSIIEIKDVVGE